MPTFTEVQTANTAKALTGKVALCVGGSSGCGKGTALVLARQGCSVTIIGRNPERGAEAVAACKSASTAEGATFKFVSLDVRSLTGIKKFCDEFAASNTRLDLLTLSCTRGGIQGYRPTEEGYDERLLSMYLARFAFVHKLLPLLLKAPEPRVLSILSAVRANPPSGWASRPRLRLLPPSRPAAAAARADPLSYPRARVSAGVPGPPQAVPQVGVRLPHGQGQPHRAHLCRGLLQRLRRRLAGARPRQAHDRARVPRHRQHQLAP